VELMSSGAFARASGLSRKALRLYDELGLLSPARVDPHSGYRFYEPPQPEQHEERLQRNADQDGFWG